MNFDQLIKLLEAIAPLLQMLIWPFIVVFIWRALKLYIEDLRKDKNVSEMGIDVSTTGFKFNFKKQVEVATMLVQAQAPAIMKWDDIGTFLFRQAIRNRLVPGSQIALSYAPALPGGL